MIFCRGREAKTRRLAVVVMPALVAGIHALNSLSPIKDVEAIGRTG
jgi:hypothetical protein